MSRSGIVLRALCGLLTATLLATAALAQPADSVVERLADDPDVVLAAIALSQEAFPDPGDASRVVIGRDDAFPDNLAATPLAGTAGPLLYTTGGPDALLRPETRAEIDRLLTPNPCPEPNELQVFDVYIVGGSAAVSAAVEQELVEAGYCVHRAGGDSRYQTARRIAEEVVRVNQRDLRVLVARADDWADAATGGAWAAWAGVPVIVTDTGALHQEAEEFLLGMTANRGSGTGVQPEAVILGGPAAISDAVEQEIGTMINSVRIAGAARDLTALAIEDQLWGDLAGTDVQLINGYADNGWAYAFAGAPLAGTTSSPQLYTQTGALNDSTCAHLADGVARVALIGPAAVIAGVVADHAAAAVAGQGCGGEPEPAAPETLALIVPSHHATDE